MLSIRHIIARKQNLRYFQFGRDLASLEDTMQQQTPDGRPTERQLDARRENMRKAQEALREKRAEKQKKEEERKKKEGQRMREEAEMAEKRKKKKAGDES